MADNFGLKIGVEGEKEFKKSLSEINQTFKVLGSEMKVVSSQFDSNDKSVGALTARNSVLNKEIEAQKEKIKVLSAALENAATSFGENDRRTQNWQIQLNNAKAALNNMEREVKQNNEALEDSADEFSDAKKQADKFGDEVKETGKQTEDASEKFKKVGQVLKGVGAAMATAVAAIGTAAVAAGKKLWDMANETASAGDEIDKTSQKLGMSAEAYQEWDYVLGQAGVDITSMTTGLKTMTNQIDDAKNGSVKAQERFKKLGISMSDLQTMSREDVFAAVVKGMQGMADTTERAALANDLFGKSGQNLTPLFNETAESTEALKQAAHDLGFVMSDEAVKASADFQDSLDTLKRTFTGVKNNLIGELLPGFSEVMNGLSELLVGGKDAKDKIQNGTKQIVESLKVILPRVTDIFLTLAGSVAEIAPVILDSLLQGIVGNMDRVVSAASNIAVSFLSSLISVLPQVAQGGVSLIVQLGDAFLSNLPLLTSTAIEVCSTLISGISSALPDLMVSLSETLVAVFTELFSADNLESFMSILLDCVSNLLSGLQESLPIIIEGLSQLALGILQAAPTIFEMLLSSLPGLIDQVSLIIQESAPLLIQAAISAVEILSQSLPEVISSLCSQLPSTISSIVSLVVECAPLLVQGAIQLVMALVSNLGTILSSLLAELPNILKMVCSVLSENVPILIRAAIDLVVMVCQNLPLIIENLLLELPSILESVSSALIQSLPILVQCGIDLVVGLVSHLPEILVELLRAAPGIILSVAKALISGLGSILEVGKNLVEGLWQGICNAASWLWDQITGWLGGIWDGILGFFGIHSPSTRMRDVVGKNIVLGLAQGITRESDTAVQAMEDVASDLASVTFTPSAVDLSAISESLNNAIPVDFDKNFNASIMTGSAYEDSAAYNKQPTINTNVTFGNVTINDGSDVEDIAHQVSDIIVSDIMVKGGAYT